MQGSFPGYRERACPCPMPARHRGVSPTERARWRQCMRPSVPTIKDTRAGFMFVCNAGLGLSSPKEEFNFPYIYMLLLLGVSAAHLAPVVSPRVRPLELCAQAQKPFDGLIAAIPEATLQDALRRDIGRRYSELTLLGWLGRCYLLAPFVFESFTIFHAESLHHVGHAIGSSEIAH